jgi:hypothetical protein
MSAVPHRQRQRTADEAREKDYDKGLPHLLLSLQRTHRNSLGQMPLEEDVDGEGGEHHHGQAGEGHAPVAARMVTATLSRASQRHIERSVILAVIRLGRAACA